MTGKAYPSTRDDGMLRNQYKQKAVTITRLKGAEWRVARRSDVITLQEEPEP